jgi:lysyl-tRNA synthetase class 2
MDDLKGLITYIKKEIDRYLQRDSPHTLTYQEVSMDISEQWKVVSLMNIFEEHTHVKYEELLQEKYLKKYVQKNGYNTNHASWEELYNQIFVNEIESQLPQDPFFLIDFPSRTSPLCKVNPEKPYIAERFEWYMFGMEIANGNNENTDFKHIKLKFEEEQRYRELNNQVSPPIDYEFLDSLEKMSAKNYAGVGLGIDRLAMIFADTKDITDIELFYKNENK